MHREKLQSGTISEWEFRKVMTQRVVTFFERTDIYEKCQELFESENITKVLSFEEYLTLAKSIKSFSEDQALLSLNSLGP